MDGNTLRGELKLENNLVSVIIPYFNKVTTIERAVDSVINQSFTNWEIIIVDDCSNIKLEKSAKWNDYKIKILYNEINLGPGPSRQKALDISSGEYVAFLDADDWWALEFLEESINVNLNHPDYAGSWAISKVTFKDRSEIRRYSQNNFELIRETMLQYPRPWQTGSILWKRHFCGSWGNLSTSQDYFFELSSSKLNNKLKKIDKVLYFVDQTQGNHRIDLIKKFDTNVNTLNLFIYFKQNLIKTVNLKYRILLFHRILRSTLKVIETIPEKTEVSIFWKQFENQYLFTKLLFRNFTLLTITHRILQKTPYKLYF